MSQKDRVEGHDVPNKIRLGTLFSEIFDMNESPKTRFNWGGGTTPKAYASNYNGEPVAPYYFITSLGMSQVVSNVFGQAGSAQLSKSIKSLIEYYQNVITSMGGDEVQRIIETPDRNSEMSLHTGGGVRP